MTLLRAFAMRYRAMAILLVVAALCMKALVPAGMMVSATASATGKAISVAICADASGHEAPREMVIPLKGKPGGKTAAGSDCAFSSLAKVALGGTDVVLLALALAFILATGFAPVQAVAAQQARHLRPPLRGPPVAAI